MSEDKNKKSSSLQQSLIIGIVVSAFAGIIIGTLRRNGMDGSALLYIGLPTIIALTFAISSPPTKTIIGSTLKTITFIILISGPLLQEGFICMIMAAPILYIVGALAAWPFDHYRKKKNTIAKLNILVIPSLLVLMSMEGVFDETTFNRLNVIEHTQTVNGTVAEVKSRIGTSRKLESPESLFGKIFPRPDSIHATGLTIGDIHQVDISYLKWVYWNEKRGQVKFKVVENQPNYLQFQAVSDDSYLSNYMTWKDTRVTLQAVSKNQTKVTWSISFHRDIDPAWYAQPLQRYAVNIAAKMMIASIQ